MASKQKSFFDQKQPDKHRWSRQYNYPKSRHFNSVPVPEQRPAPPKPAIAASLQSKTKLNAFRYQQKFKKPEQAMRASGDTLLDKENAVQHEGQRSGQKLLASQEASKQPAREFPSTPAGRVPLADLIGDNEDHQEASPRRSPLEAVSWDRSPRGSNDSFMTPVMRRGKKRARSSSPASSSQKIKTTKPAFDLQNLQASLKTPQNDPVAEFESRYFARNRHQTPSKPSSSAAPDFMHSSSPQTPALSGGESAKLRRTASCGIAYPRGSKRRKMSREDKPVLKENPKDNASISEKQGELEAISRLLDSINDGLQSASRSPSQRDGPSSSCPLPAENGDEIAPILPPESLHQISQHSQAPSQTVAPKIPSQRSHGPSQRSESSEFGDADVDQAFTNFDTDRIVTTVIPSESAAITSIQQRISKSQEATAVGLTAAPTMKPPIYAPLHDSDTTLLNDINDDDDDEFAAELEFLASKYDQHPAGTSSNIEIAPQIPEQDLELPVSGATILETPTKGNKAVIELSSDEEFGDDDFDEDIFDEVLLRATQARTHTPPKKKIPSTNASLIQRYVILNVNDNPYETENGRTQHEKVLLLEDQKKTQQRVVMLRGAWYESDCAPSDLVHILGSFDKNGHCVIDNDNNWFIVHPDHLISATVVADSFTCTRRAVLQDRVKATSAANQPQVYGHILHEVFQEAMKANRWDTQWLFNTIEVICSRYLESLYEINIEFPSAVNYLRAKVPELQSWARLFMASRPKPDAVVQDRKKGSVRISVNKLLDVEEHVWSPKYGLKGNIDATVQVVMQDQEGERTLTVPFEIKTGRNNSNISHQAQTALYTLLLSDRYDINVLYGILYYLETSDTSRIVGIRGELVGMIKQRNSVARFVRNRQTLPPMLQDKRMCEKCYAQRACFTYHRLVEDGDGKTSNLKGIFMDAVKHLQPAHREFFRKWDSLLSKEEGDVFRFRKELWTMLSTEREKIGRCFGGLVIQPESTEEMTDTPKINRFKYVFVKQKASSTFSFTDSQITIGEPIVISDEQGHYALANGYVTHVRKSRITVAVDRRLHNARVRSKHFDAERNQSFAGIMRVVDKGDVQTTLTPKEPSEPIIYRLDKDEFSNGMATVRNNLIRLMDADLFGAHNLRKLIVELQAPSFDIPATKAKNWISASQAVLNVDQQAAIEKVMTAKDYALVLGMPGTGKTTTIAHIIRALAAQGKSVLLTSYTHTAVDNILLKIRGDGIPILRLGALSKIHPDVQTFATLACTPKGSFEEIESSYASQVVATTCLGINHPLFNQRIFDYCIVDEASQITLPVCLGPIGMARRFVLVGDHFQLPPLVQNKEAAKGGLDVSLFKLLSDAHPASVVSLAHQYRMAADIMSLSNTLIYSGRLKCGTPAVAARRIAIPAIENLKFCHHTLDTLPVGQTAFCPSPTAGSCWLGAALDPDRRVVFLNTDPLGLSAREVVSGARITNAAEVTLATHVVEALLAVGVSAADIGVITLYRSQLALLKRALRHRTSGAHSSHHLPSHHNNNGPPYPHHGSSSSGGGLEMYTADKFQGRDKEALVLSLVRSNEAGAIGELLADWRRVNVALTRARTKLVILGSLTTVAHGTELLGRFCALCREKGWVLDLPEGAPSLHWFEEWRSQTQGPSGLGEDGDGTARMQTRARRAGQGMGGEGEGEWSGGSDLEVGASGKSPKKSGQGRKGCSGSAAVTGKGLGGVQKMKTPVKMGRTDPRKLLGRRPVLRDVLNEVMGE